MKTMSVTFIRYDIAGEDYTGQFDDISRTGIIHIEIDEGSMMLINPDGVREAFLLSRISHLHIMGG